METAKNVAERIRRRAVCECRDTSSSPPIAALKYLRVRSRSAKWRRWSTGTGSFVRRSSATRPGLKRAQCVGQPAIVVRSIFGAAAADRLHPCACKDNCPRTHVLLSTRGVDELGDRYALSIRPEAHSKIARPTRRSTRSGLRSGTGLRAVNGCLRTRRRHDVGIPSPPFEARAQSDRLSAALHFSSSMMTGLLTEYSPSIFSFISVLGHVRAAPLANSVSPSVSPFRTGTSTAYRWTRAEALSW